MGFTRSGCFYYILNGGQITAAEVYTAGLDPASGKAITPRQTATDQSGSNSSVFFSPDGRSVAVLSQRSSVNASFFATRWRLWRVTLDGKRSLLDAPPLGAADEAPLWSRDGRSVLFVRERNGYGQLMLRRRGHTTGLFANLGYAIGYYGYHDWQWRWSAGAP